MCTTVTIHGFTGEMTKIFILYDGHSNLILFHMSYYATIGALNSEHCGPSNPQNKDTCSIWKHLNQVIYIRQYVCNRAQNYQEHMKGRSIQLEFIET